ncbi:MAG: hypothetical protein LBG21_01240 [Campylobacteraceae bacterium]|jgi:hypothetical protein|nr:hypothetical protein [Campylobacteraceae bacterium]
MKKFLKTLGLGFVSVASLSSFAMADAMDLSGITFATSDVFAVGALILAGVAAIWGIRKVIGLASR